MLNVCEIFKSIQGESTYAGRVCSFVRFTGCNLRCVYCDTRYAFSEGVMQPLDMVINTLDELGCTLVELTGGEPLLQADLPQLCSALLARNYTVLVETNGSLPIDILPDRCIRIVDVKCPGSGQGESFLVKNIGLLRKADEVKFVISDRYDFSWACEFVNRYAVCEKATVLFSPCMGRIDSADLAAWIVDSNMPVRLGVQLHKMIWGDKRGV